MIEQKSQVETPATISSRIQEDRDRLDATKASDPTKKTLSDDEGYMARHDIREATVSLNAEFTGTTNQVRHKLTELSAKNSENLSPNFGQPLADEKVFLPSVLPIQLNNGKTENLRTIGKRQARSGPKQLVDRRNFSDEMKNLLQSPIRKKHPIPNTKGILPMYFQTVGAASFTAR